QRGHHSPGIETPGALVLDLHLKALAAHGHTIVEALSLDQQLIAAPVEKQAVQLRRAALAQIYVNSLAVNEDLVALDLDLIFALADARKVFHSGPLTARSRPACFHRDRVCCSGG